jgi:Flp pilus assembly protein CpaB
MLREIMQNIDVVGVSGTGGVGASRTSNVSLRVNDRQAAELAFASDNGKIWLALRPSAGAKASPPAIVSVETLLLGVPPVTIVHSLGGHP